MQSVWPLFSGGYIPGLHMTQGVFMKLFRLLEDTCHQFDLQLAYTYQEESSSSSSSFTKYAEELHKLQVAKAKLPEAQDSLAALEEAVMYVVVAYGEDSPITDILIRHALDRRQSVEKMLRPPKEFALHDGPFVKGLDEALQSFKVQWQQYFGGVFVGNHIHKTLQLGIDYSAMAASQIVDQEVQSYRTALSGLVLQDIPFGEQGDTLLYDTSTGHARPVVPVSWRRQVFDLMHSLSHPSIRTTRKLISSKFVWNGLRKIGSKIQAHIKAPLEQFDVPNRRFDRIHVDLVGPLPPSNGFTHLLTIVDCFSRWPEAIPLNDRTTVVCAQALISQWFARFGIPADMTSDRGTSQLCNSIAQLLGIQVHHTTAYHPQANGLVERFHRHLKASLCARLTGPNWTADLPWVLLGIRTAPKDDLGCSSAELVYGTPLAVPVEFFPNYSSRADSHTQLQQLRDRVRSYIPIPTSRHVSTLSSLSPDLKQSRLLVPEHVSRGDYSDLEGAPFPDQWSGYTALCNAVPSTTSLPVLEVYIAPPNMQMPQRMLQAVVTSSAASPTLLLASAKIAGVRGDVTVKSKAAGLPCAQSLTSTSAGRVRAIQSWSEATSSF
ncbi:hypothetical protein EMCRGX_G022658 [Ephydatia muelleri]